MSTARRARQPVSAAIACLFVLAVSSSTALATDFTVTKTADTNDGACDADCSLREAIVAANANPGLDLIVLGVNQTYTLTRGPADAPGALDAASGDLDITQALTIDGHGSTIDAAMLDRAFDIQGSFTVTIDGLTIRNGVARGFLSHGGGLFIRGATVVMNNSTVTGNHVAAEADSRDDGGGIAVIGSYNAATGTATLASLTLISSTISQNTATNGGGIVCVLCSLTVSKGVLHANSADGGDGAGIDLLGHASTLTMTSSTFLLNAAMAGGRGGALAAPFGSSVTTVSRSRIAANSATPLIGAGLFNSVGTVTATNNWWGCSFGPGATGAGCAGVTNGVSGSATTTPYLVMKIGASPPSIVVGSSSAVTADLTFNSSNVDTSAGGTLPDGMLATFSGTLGSFPPGSVATANGKATGTYTASSVGAAGVSAIVDGQTVSTTINVAGIAPIITTNPSNRLVTPGSNTTFTVAASGNPAATYQWQLSTNSGASWSNLTDAAPYSGTATPTLTVSSATVGLSGYWYRAVATNVAGSATSNVAVLTIDTSADDRVIAGLGPYSTDGGWIAARKGKAGAFGLATWLHLPWATYNATGGGLHVAAGDVDGDGLDEIVAGLGPGSNGWIAVFDDAAHGYTFLKWIQLTWPTYNASNGEVWPAVGDLDGDGRAEIVAGLGQGGAGWFEIFDDAANNFDHVAWRQVNWPTYNASGSGATHPAVGNVDGVGASEIIIGLGSGSNGWLEVVGGSAGSYSHQAWFQVALPAYAAANGTTFPAAGDLDGDGRAEIVAGLGAGGAGRLEVFEDASGSFAHLTWLQASWTTYNETGSGETHPAVGNVDGDPRAEIVIGLDVMPGDGGWFETLDDSAAGFASLGWRNLDWAAFGAAGGATFPAVGNFR